MSARSIIEMELAPAWWISPLGKVCPVSADMPHVAWALDHVQQHLLDDEDFVVLQDTDITGADDRVMENMYADGWLRLAADNETLWMDKGGYTITPGQLRIAKHLAAEHGLTLKRARP